MAIGPAGDLYVSDGYGNARIHRFAPDGRLIHSWGEPGSGPSQFYVPHGIAVDRAGPSTSPTARIAASSFLPIRAFM